MELFLELGTTFLSGALGYLVLEASKYVGPNFDFGLFYKKNIKPLQWTALGSGVLILIYSFLPEFMPFVEVQVGGQVDITSYEGIMLGGGFVGAVLKNIIRRKEKAANPEN